LFKAQPLLAPIYIQVDRMVPPVFPLLLVGPALVMDLIRQRFAGAHSFWRDWGLAIAMGVGFFAVFLALQWNFAGFLLSERADNWLFAGGRQWPYFIKPSAWRHRFWEFNGDYLRVGTAVMAMLCAIVAARFGLAMGGWMSRVRR